MTASEYITDYLARRAPFYMVAPHRHHNPLIKALFWKQERWEQAAVMEDCAKPSAEFDEAFDAYINAGNRYEAIIKDAWVTRAMSRGSVPALALVSAELAGAA